MRKTNAFYKDLHAVRSKWGEKEYARSDILPDVVQLFVKHKVDHDSLLWDAANETLNSVEKGEDKNDDLGPGLFPYDAHVALGEGCRIKRGRMNVDQLTRRKRVIDDNKAKQDIAWQRETRWLNDRQDALDGHARDTVVEDVLPEGVGGLAAA